MSTRSGICIPSAAVRTGLIVLAVAAAVGLAQQAPTIWRYVKFEGM